MLKNVKIIMLKKTKKNFDILEKKLKIIAMNILKYLKLILLIIKIFSFSIISGLVVNSTVQINHENSTNDSSNLKNLNYFYELGINFVFMFQTIFWYFILTFFFLNFSRL
jgi:hypothetical protein